jgi:maleylacetate reductase
MAGTPEPPGGELGVRDFVHDVPASRVLFGPGRRKQLASELDRLSLARVLVVADPGLPAGCEVVELLGPRAVAEFSEVVMHVPVDVAGRAVQAAREAGADAVVAVGGGSAIGTAKAVARQLQLPVVAVPTTYAGSEMTPIWGLTEGGHKTTGRDPHVLPRVVVYDPELTVSLPTDLSAASGMNALAHLVEGLYAPEASPLTVAVAREGLRALARGLPAVVDRPDDLDARGEVTYGAWLAGWVLGTTGMGVHHKICHVLGGTYDLPHAASHSAVVPYAVAFNSHAAPSAMAAIEAAFRDAGRRADHAAGAVWDLRTAIGAPGALAALGFRADAIDRAAGLVAEGRPVNPRPVDLDGVRAVLMAAHGGARPPAYLP